MDHQPGLSDSAQQTGIYVADIEHAAMKRAYESRINQNTKSFVRQHCNESPSQIGEYLADIQSAAKCQALNGFLWRWFLIGGLGSVFLFFTTVELIVIPIVALVSVPVSIALTLKNEQ